MYNIIDKIIIEKDDTIIDSNGEINGYNRELEFVFNKENIYIYTSHIGQGDYIDDDNCNWFEITYPDLYSLYNKIGSVLKKKDLI